MNQPDWTTWFPFALDPFQEEAIAALNTDQSIVVSAPTGSGKTVIGEYAIHRALAKQQRVFYTTPLKALSNQKLRDFRDQFGPEVVGLLTGDRAVNRDAPILVMTTEIFRNILYGTLQAAVGTSIANVAAVVLDECHYMNDSQRGTVWEESIIYCPPRIQLIALSATIANAQQLTDWMHEVHGPTQLIASNWRPVPLSFHFSTAKGLRPLLNPQQTKLNPQLRTHRAPSSSSKRSRRSEFPDVQGVLNQLAHQEMLPAIYFIFSRRGCEQAVREARQLTLVTPAEAQQLQLQIDTFMSQHGTKALEGDFQSTGRSETIANPDQIEALRQGIAAHHAGLLPLWKALVEELFQQGLIKIVFATETLAAGINMPARTTVISSLSKRTDRGHRLLTPSEFLQMAGRAGRRGMDKRGHVVTLQTRFEGAKEAATLAMAEADPLVSQFTPSYGMVLNLLQTHTLEEAKTLIERSFGQYLASLHLQPQKQAIADLMPLLAQLDAQLDAVDLPTLHQYQKLQQRLKEEQRLLKLLEDQAAETQSREVALCLTQAPPGTILGLKPSHSQEPATVPLPLSAILVTQVPSSGQFPYFACLSQDNHWQVVTRHQVVGLQGQLSSRLLSTLSLPDTLPRKPGPAHCGDLSSAAIAQQIPHCDWPLPPEVLAQQQRVDRVQTQLQAHPAHGSRKRHSYWLRAERRRQSLQTQLSDRQAKLKRQSHQYWQAFLSLVEILQHFQGLADLTPTSLGQVAAALRGENELWLGLALRSGELDQLPPHQLAAACAALVCEAGRADSWTNYTAAPEIQAPLTRLRPLRRQLQQHQLRYGVMFPAWLEIDCVGLVEQWALGAEWSELCTNTSLDEGDIVRRLRRTLDFLAQIPHAPHLSANLYQNAKRAIQLLDRFPVQELSPMD
jgi:superfamily II RNA helicase